MVVWGFEGGNGGRLYIWCVKCGVLVFGLGGVGGFGNFALYFLIKKTL